MTRDESVMVKKRKNRLKMTKIRMDAVFRRAAQAAFISMLLLAGNSS